MFDDWKKDETGNISVNPLVGYSTMIAAETAIGVKLDYLVAGDKFETPSGGLQLVITPIQAQQLAQALLTAAEKVLSIKPRGQPS
ncbi:chemotaxis protein [Tardiphaga sp. 20_F10_N6_6]|uniref:chemotaxis protein n=1 Tax=Tardiphaga sp. 20_F10_N6_6 TaxID=3240788 RepID=UPI003F8A7504